MIETRDTAKKAIEELNNVITQFSILRDRTGNTQQTRDMYQRIIQQAENDKRVLETILSRTE